MTINRDKAQEFMARVAADSAAAMHASTVVLGHRLGLYRALGQAPQRPEELAERTGCHPRLLHEWLNAQFVSDYCEYDPATGRYSLTAEQAACLADETSPTFLVGGMLSANVVHRDEEQTRKAFTGDGGLSWHQHDHDLSSASERAFRGIYETNLVANWVPALEGIYERLGAGGRVADVGCGFGSSTILLAEAFPKSTCSGFDYHEPSVQAARQAAADAGVTDRVTFETADARAFPGTGYDLVCMFNAFHETGDPRQVARHTRSALDPEGSLMIVEPYASHAPADNRTTVGRNFYSVSTMVCVPNALSQGADTALGAQAGAARLCEMLTGAGFGRVRVAAQTPLSLVIEAKP
jgi:2-polyprenyl-3-methyl-5-hydroxy-6-metoxy-1,4-benzoquinol methylase